MASPQILDIEALLTPIEGDNPAGVDLREDVSPTSDYYQVKDARTAARAAERSAASSDEPGPRPDEWRTIIKIAPPLIAEKTKDLELASWLTEALLREHGFDGLRDGFNLVLCLVENFWDELYPLKDEDGLETKVAPLSGLNGEGADGTLIQPIRMVPITDGSEFGPYGLWNYEQANELSSMADEAKKQQRIAAGAPTLEDFERSVQQSSSEFYVTRVADLEECVGSFGKLSAALDEKCGHDAPPTSNIRNTLNSLLETVKFIGKDKLPVAEEGDEAVGEEAVGDGAAAPKAAARPAGEIASREDAFRALLKIAEYFRKTEPHSLMPYTLEELVRRGRLSLPELLGELIQDPAVRNDFLSKAGIKPPED